MTVLYHLKKILFGCLVLLCFLPKLTPQIGFLMGIFFALILGNPWQKKIAYYSKILLQAAVVGLGFGINFKNIVLTTQYAWWFTAIGIAVTMIIGIGLGRLLKTKLKTSILISAGTAICGGSAIAAIAPTIKAKNKHTTVALASVFLLNSIALLILPPIAHYLNLSQEVFGIWAALAIHDTNSVVGATVGYDSTALALAITIKLTRALWILPLTCAIGYFRKGKERTRFPLFLIGFIAASLLNTFVPQASSIWTTATALSKHLLTLTLFLVGTGLTRKLIRKVGIRAFTQAFLLWIFICSASLLAVMWGCLPELSALVPIARG